VTSLEEFRAEFDQWRDAIDKANRAAVSKSALEVTRIIRANISAATHGTNRLSGVGRGGARVGARYDLKGTVNPTALIRATGPVHLLERGRRGGYLIEPRRRGRGGRGRRRALYFDGIYATHARPGPVAGTRPFGRGVDAGIPKAAQTFQDVHAATMRRHFG